MERAAGDDLRKEAALQGSPAEMHDHRATAAWTARSLIIAVACGLAWYTWGHWGDFQVDCGRELYVPAAILKGKLLFRDIWYMYGPLAPYLQAMLFRLFGIHLTALYVFGFTLTVSAAVLLFEVGLELGLAVMTSVVAPLFFLSEAFYPFIFNFVFPYSYAASLAAVLGLACLYFVLRHVREARKVHLAAAAVLAALAALTKQEFGFACIVLLGIPLLYSFLMQRSPRELARNASVCLAGLFPAIAVYGWFAVKVSPKVLFLDNWISTPGTYFMRMYGSRTMAQQGFRFSAGEFLENVEYTLLAVALWSTLASANVLIIKKLRLRSRWWIALVAAANVVPIALILNTEWASRIVLVPLARVLHGAGPGVTGMFTAVQETVTQMVLPSGLFFVGVFSLMYAGWRFWSGQDRLRGTQEAALGTYALLVSVRVMMETSPSPYKYAMFYNGAIFLIFVMYLERILRWAARSLETKQRNFFAASLLAVEIGVLFVMLFPEPDSLPTPFTTEYGTLYTRPDVAEILPQVVSFMKTHTQNRKDILVLPEPPGFYVFAGMEAPSRWYSLLPGVLAPEQEPEFIRDIVASDVKYILIGNRALPEYGTFKFGVGYDRLIYAWMLANFRQAGQFGPYQDKAMGLPYIIWIYERKDLAKSASR